jgi:hypothetical protein
VFSAFYPPISFKLLRVLNLDSNMLAAPDFRLSAKYSDFLQEAREALSFQILAQIFIPMMTRIATIQLQRPCQTPEKVRRFDSSIHNKGLC